VSQTPNDSQAEASEQWGHANDSLSRMIEEGRSFSGRERNCCFLNTSGPQFANISAVSGLDFPDDGRALALVDWDHDGDLDLWTSNRNAPRLRLMRNDLPSEDRFLGLRLQGNGATTNRDAIGARVEVLANDADGRKLLKTLRAGEGFLSQSSKWMHFGLGEATQIERVTVLWPGGEAEDFSEIQTNARYVLVQGSGRAALQTPRGEELALTPSRIEIPEQSGPSSVRPTSLLPMPRRIRYRGFDGSSRQITLGEGEPVLINLWASWCTPCLQELQEFSENADEFRTRGVDVVALSVDGLDDDKTDRLAAPRVLSRLAFPFAAGKAELKFIRMLQGFHDEAVVLKRTLPIPASVLVDGRGRLATIYKGRVQLEALWHDVMQLQAADEDRWVQSAPLEGRAIKHERVEAVRQSQEARFRWGLAEALDKAGRLELAAEHYRDLLRVQPKTAKANRKLADVYTRLKQIPAAIERYRRAIELEPDVAAPHYNLANLLNREGQYDEAVTHYREAIRLKNDYFESHVNLGSVFVKMEQYDEAVTEFERAIEINPEFEPARQNLERLRAFLQSK
jgi:tetratricopeptide (TPR) repeat protein